jgi:hypothetical protein
VVHSREADHLECEGFLAEVARSAKGDG